MLKLIRGRHAKVILMAVLLYMNNVQAQMSSGPADSIGRNYGRLKKISSLRLDLQAVAIRKFPGMTLANQNKSAGIIAELLNRAEQQELDLLPKGRFSWTWSGFDNPESMVGYADSLLQVLSSGRDPFKGKFAEPGGQVIDHALIEKNGVHHIFYIRGTAATSWPVFPTRNFGHAVSRNLEDWTIADPVLQTAESGWDNFQVWAPYILKHKGKFFMFYAGVNDSISQAIGLATSDDLYNWRRYGEKPVITTGSWGTWNNNRWSDCRDPMVLRDGDSYYCYYTAQREDSVTHRTEPCIGVSRSKDLYHWKDQGFIRLEQNLESPPESPFVIKRKGVYYLFYTSYRYGTVYARSRHPVKGWRQEPGDQSALVPGVSASEVYQSRGQWYLSFISHDKNGLHFFEIRKMNWGKTGKPSIEAIKH